MNYPDSVTINGPTVTGHDPDTGVPTAGTVTVLDQARCAFAVLSAAEAKQSWGTGTPTQTQAITASLILPSWSGLSGDLQSYTITVDGYDGTWRVVAARPGDQWTTYQLLLN